MSVGLNIQGNYWPDNPVIIICLHLDFHVHAPENKLRYWDLNYPLAPGEINIRSTYGVFLKLKCFWLRLINADENSWYLSQK